MAVAIILMSVLGVASVSFVFFRIAEALFRRNDRSRPALPTVDRVGVPITVWTGDDIHSLPDRSAVRAHVAHLLASPSRRSVGLVCFFEFDEMNRVAAEHHEEVVLETARRLHQACRADDLIGRSGANQLLVVAAGVYDNDGALALAARLGRLAALPIEIGDQIIVSPASVGVTNLLPGDAAEEALLRAEEHMHIARGDLEPDIGI